MLTPCLLLPAAAGFCIAQLGLNDSPAGTIIYLMSRREDDEQARAGNSTVASCSHGYQRVCALSSQRAALLRTRCGCVRWAAAEGSFPGLIDLFPQAAAAAIALRSSPMRS